MHDELETAVQEVFAVTVLPGRRWPDLINDDDTLLENSFVVPDAALADVVPWGQTDLEFSPLRPKASSSATRSRLAFDWVWSRAANRADRLATAGDRRGANRHCVTADQQVRPEPLALSVSGYKGMVNR
jgi:hypothetical protein